MSSFKRQDNSNNLVEKILIGSGAIIGAGVLLYSILNRSESENSTQSRSSRVNQTQSTTSRVNCGNFDGSSINTCGICMQEFTNFNTKQDISVLECKHKFHRECVRLLLTEGRYQKTCPMCRKTISNSVVSQII